MMIMKMMVMIMMIMKIVEMIMTMMVMLIVMMVTMMSTKVTMQNLIRQHCLASLHFRLLFIMIIKGRHHDHH